jgi:hypothetical protein
MYKFSNLLNNPEENYVRAIEHCKVLLSNPEYEDLLTSMECSDLSEVTFYGSCIRIIYPACLMDQYKIDIKIFLYNLNKSEEMLGHYVLVENEVGEVVDDSIVVY